MPGPFDLAVVTAVYNEEDRLPAFLGDWSAVFERLKIHYTWIIVDDGSTDRSLDLMRSFLNSQQPHQIVSQKNAGHGAAILRGYQQALDAPWIFQVDSDHQLDPATFDNFWAKRDDYDLVLGERTMPHATGARKMLSRLSRNLLHGLFNSPLRDVNCPFRLIRRSLLRESLVHIPPDSFAPNVLISAFASFKKYQIDVLPVRFRAGARMSTMSSYIAAGAMKAFFQTLQFRFRI